MIYLNEKMTVKLFGLSEQMTVKLPNGTQVQLCLFKCVIASTSRSFFWGC